MKKYLLILSWLFLIIVFSYVAKNTLIFKIINVTNETNTINANLPYVKYNFNKVYVYKGINNNYLFWEVNGVTEDNGSLHEFDIRGAFNVKYNIPLYYSEFHNRRVDLFWYTFLFFTQPHLLDELRVVFLKGDNNIVIWLWYIEDFTNHYLQDVTFPKDRKYNDILQNLDYIPHIIIKS